MWILMMLVVASAVAAGCSNQAAASPAGPSPQPQLRPIVAFGDSLTSGYGLDPERAYPAVLERMLRAAGLPFDVVNHGVSGDTTARALRRLDAALAEEPSILIVALGANDGVRGVPVPQVRANLEAIIEAAQRRNIQVLLCGMEAFPLYGWDYTVEFHRLFPALAEKYGVPLVPFLLDGVVANPEMLQPDFVHPNAAGASRMAQTVWMSLQPLAVKTAAIDTR
jgi:acyl-CoA thioesterase-1